MRRRVDWGNLEQLAPVELTGKQLRRKEKKERQKMRKDEEKTHSTHGHHSLDSPAVDDDSQEIAEDGVPSPPGSTDATEGAAPETNDDTDSTHCGDHLVDNNSRNDEKKKKNQKRRMKQKLRKAKKKMEQDKKKRKKTEERMRKREETRQRQNMRKEEKPDSTDAEGELAPGTNDRDSIHSGDHSIDSPAVDDDSTKIAQDEVLSLPSKHLTPNGAGGSSGDHSVDSPAEDGVLSSPGKHQTHLQTPNGAGGSSGDHSVDLPAVDDDSQKIAKDGVLSPLSQHLTPSGAGGSSSPPSGKAAVPQIMQEMMKELVGMDKELQKQMTRMEEAVEQKLINFETELSKQMTTKEAADQKLIDIQKGLPKQMTMEKAVDEKLINFHGKLQEQMAGMEKAVEIKLINFKGELLEQMKKMMETVRSTNGGALSAQVKKEISENAGSSGEHMKQFNEAFNQLEKSVNSMLEVNVPEQIRALGQQAFQEALMSSMNSSVLPAFVQACRQLLMGVCVDPRIIQLTSVPHEKVEMPFGLLKLVAEGNYDVAFRTALEKCDAGFVTWLCAQLDLCRLLSLRPLCLSQPVLLSLVQLLSQNLYIDTTRRIRWITDLETYLVLTDPAIAVRVKPVLSQVHNAVLQLYPAIKDTISADDGNTILHLLIINGQKLKALEMS